MTPNGRAPAGPNASSGSSSGADTGLPRGSRHSAEADDEQTHDQAESGPRGGDGPGVGVVVTALGAQRNREPSAVPTAALWRTSPTSGIGARTASRASAPVVASCEEAAVRAKSGSACMGTTRAGHAAPPSWVRPSDVSRWRPALPGHHAHAHACRLALVPRRRSRQDRTGGPSEAGTPKGRRWSRARCSSRVVPSARDRRRSLRHTKATALIARASGSEYNAKLPSCWRRTTPALSNSD